MFSIPLRLTVGILVWVVVPGLAAVLGQWLPTGLGQAPPADDPWEPVSPSTIGSAISTRSSPPTLNPSAPIASPPPGPAPTDHARLILDGYFAKRIGLLTALKELDLSGKTVCHSPQDHLVTALVNVLAGHHQLQQISRGNSPLRGDLALARAWDQQQFPEVSGVCRRLHALDWSQAQAVREHLHRVFAPYIAQCVSRTFSRDQRLVVDWDLTPKQITTEAHSDPFAAYGHMEDGVGKGYQWAEAVLRGMGPNGCVRAVSLGGFLCPGNAHPDSCLERLRLVTERALGRPRRRPELLQIRLTEAQTQQERRQESVVALQARLRAQEQRAQTRQSQLQAINQRQTGRRPQQQVLLARDGRARQACQKSLAAGHRQLVSVQARLVAAERALAEAKEATSALRARLARLEADNAALEESHQRGVGIEVILDSQFGGSKLMAILREEGYELTTKAISPATMARLRRRERQGENLFGPWKPVSANAEVAECLETSYANCPYPWRLLGYRKHLASSASRPAKTSYALFLTSIPAQERGAQETVQHYHLRGGTAELLNRQAKSNLGFRGHRLRHAPGLDVLGQFVFAGLNFVPWLADTVWTESGTEAGERPGLAVLTQMARAPGQVMADEDGVAIQFAQNSGWPQRTLHLGVLRQPPLPGFVWPGLPINAQAALQNSNHDLVARKLG